MATQAASLKTNAPASASAAAIVFAPLDAHGRVGWLETIRTAFESLFMNRVRSLLTMLGVIIGVASVVALMALGEGATSSITSQVQSMGTNVLTVMNGSASNRGPGSDMNQSAALNLSIDDAEAIQALALPLNGLAPQFSSNADVVAPAADKSATIVGTTPAYSSLNSLTLQSGTFFDAAQNKSGAAVVVLGSTLAQDLFGSGQAVGQTVRLNGQPLRVIGVLAAKGGGAFGSVDSQALVPIQYAYQYFQNTRTPDGNRYRVSSISLSVTNVGDMDAVQGRIQALLREQHHLPQDGSKDDFQVLNFASVLSALTSITAVLTAFLAAIGGISLLVGGIGIMNIMLVSVTERTKEIGLRKAVGARSRDILLQFIVEAISISLTGGLVGLLLGSGLALGVTLAGLMTASVTPSSVLIAVGFSMAVGLFFGIYPAQRAARLNPIDALHYE